mgnify:CR=1 FL=1
MNRTAMTRKTPMVRTLFKSEPKPAAGPKLKKCAVRTCRAPYTPDPKQLFKVWCSPDCGEVLALDRVAKSKAKAQRQERASDKVKLEGMKKRTTLIAEAQAAFNAAGKAFTKRTGQPEGTYRFDVERPEPVWMKGAPVP